MNSDKTLFGRSKSMSIMNMLVIFGYLAYTEAICFLYLLQRQSWPMANGFPARSSPQSG